MELPVLNDTPASGGGCSSHSCGTTDDQLGHLTDEIRAKVENHPC
jgi:nitrogen fixation protein NifB